MLSDKRMAVLAAAGLALVWVPTCAPASGGAPPPSAVGPPAPAGASAEKLAETTAGPWSESGVEDASADISEELGSTGADTDASGEGSPAPASASAPASAPPAVAQRRCERGGRLVADTKKVCINTNDRTADSPLVFAIDPLSAQLCNEKPLYRRCDIAVKDHVVKVDIRVCLLPVGMKQCEGYRRSMGDFPFFGCQMDKPLPPGTYTIVSSGRSTTLTIPSVWSGPWTQCF